MLGFYVMKEWDRLPRCGKVPQGGSDHRQETPTVPRSLTHSAGYLRGEMSGSEREVGEETQIHMNENRMHQDALFLVINTLCVTFSLEECLNRIQANERD